LGARFGGRPFSLRADHLYSNIDLFGIVSRELPGEVVRATGTRPSILSRPPSGRAGAARLLALATIASATTLSSSPSLALDPVIDRFVAVPDCIFPDPRRGILSYTVSLAARIRIAAIEETFLFGPSITRTFHDAPGSFPSSVRTNIADPRPSANVVAYELIATGEDGTRVTRRLDFRYRRAAFDLLPPVAHLRGTGPPPRETRYESDANLVNVRSLSCSFKFDARIEGEDGRAGTARIFEPRRGDQWVSCIVAWGSDAKARAGGTVEWTARVRDRCTQGVITHTARVNPIR
jgi:hypothetical protein